MCILIIEYQTGLSWQMLAHSPVSISNEVYVLTLKSFNIKKSSKKNRAMFISVEKQSTYIIFTFYLQ